MDNSSVFERSATAPSPSFNPHYLISVDGVLKCFHFIFGMVVWGLAASIGVVGCNMGAYQFVMVVTVIAWILSTGLLVIFVMEINSGAGAAVPWAIIEFIYHSVWSVFYLIAASVQAAHTCQREHLVAAAVIGFLVFLSYVAHAVFSFRKWKGYFPWQSGHGGNEIEA